jgi:ATP-binding cassette subfamily C protein
MTSQQLLFWAGIAAIAMLLASNAANLVSEIGRVRYARGFVHWLSVRLLTEMTNRPYSYFLERNSGELFKKILTDVPSYVNGVLLPVLEAAARAVTSVVLVAFLLVASPSIALGSAIFFGLFYLVFFWMLQGLRVRISDNLKIARRGISKEASQLLGAIKPVKVHGVEEHFLKRFALHSDAQAREAAWIPIIGKSTKYVIEPLAFGGLVVVVLLKSANEQSFAELVPMLGVMALAGYRLLPAIQMLYNSLTTISTNRHSVDEIIEEFTNSGNHLVLGKPKSKRTGPSEAPFPDLHAAIEVRNLGFAYGPASPPVFAGLSFRIEANCSFAIVGKTGSGKSTLVDLLLGLHPPGVGTIEVDGVEITEGNSRSWRRQIGYVPQEIFLLDDTVTANIAFGLPSELVDMARVRASAKRAQIIDFIEYQLAGGFTALVGERGVRLSGGQRQRIGLARALYRNPRVLILDEATSALDEDTETALVEALEELHGELTMIVIAHRLSTIQRCEYRLDLDAVAPGLLKSGAAGTGEKTNH